MARKVRVRRTQAEIAEANAVRAAARAADAELYRAECSVCGRLIPEVEADFGGKGYGDLKADVGEAVVELFRPMKERYDELRADEPALLRLLQIGAAKARESSAPTLREMYERMGFVLP